jgi:hypothetical protein
VTVLSMARCAARSVETVSSTLSSSQWAGVATMSMWTSEKSVWPGARLKRKSSSTSNVTRSREP